jgi:hypothetical protein
MNLANAIQLYKNMGTRYTLYRVKHEFEKRIGLLKKRHPVDQDVKFFISLEDWIANNTKYIFPELEIFSKKVDFEVSDDKISKILNGEICYFNYEWKNLGKNYDWITNPETGFKYNIKNHWSEIPDLIKQAGDIKYVWEKSRFSYLWTIMRYDLANSKDHSEFVFSEIESWIKNNPINQGPNWRCSQEISLRILNWNFALQFYKNSKYLTPELWSKIQNVIYWSLDHIYKHIDFSRIAVRNNHAITETLTLALSEFLFPYFPESKKWSSNGRKWFEEEIEYQIYDDGTFLQFSMNYHRVVIQLLTLALTISEFYKKPFSKMVYTKSYKSLNFLYQCLQVENGHLPNYGSNDGALFFPLNDLNYRDYRPQLNTLHKILTGLNLFEDNKVIEDSIWFTLNLNNDTNFLFSKIEKHYGSLSFDIGGYYLLIEKDTFTFIRCGNHIDRPAHADNLHLDIWYKGINVLKDSGTYKYNTEEKFLQYFTGTASHNTVMVEENSQMLKGNRFIWYYWSKSEGAKWVEKEDCFIFEGKISAFQFLNKGAKHKRIIKKMKGESLWQITDVVENLPKMKKFQIWHFEDKYLDLSTNTNEDKSVALNWESYFSDYYGKKLKGNAVAFEFNDSIETTLTLVK